MLRALTLFLVAALPLSASADDTDPDVTKARERFRIGQERFNAGDFPGALQEFETARLIKAVPEFEYNIGVCQEHLGHPREAIDAYHRFIDSIIDPTAIAEARQRIAKLEAQLAPPKVEATPAPAAPVVVVAPAGPSYALPATLFVGTLALASIGVALVAPVYHDYESLSAAWDRMPTLELARQADYMKTRLEAGYALFAVAGVVAVIDLILWVRAARSGGEKPALAPPAASAAHAAIFRF